MQSHSTDDWRRLGGVIKSQRKQAGMRDIKDWADAVGRSTRVLLGLERGERVGDDTLELVEAALDWPAGRCEVILSTWTAVTSGALDPAAEDAQVRVLRPVPELPPEALPLLEAIRNDTTLLPEAREHLMNQYQLLLRIQGPQQERLPYVAHGERTTPVDEAQEVALEEAAKAAAKANPRSPKRTK